MLSTPAILIADSTADGRSLSTLLLQRELPGAIVTAAADPLALAEALLAAAPDVAIIASDLEWFNVSELVAAIKQRHPGTAIVLFACEPDVTARALKAGLALDGIVQKSPAGFMRLGPVVAEVLARIGRHNARIATPSVMAPASAPKCDDVQEAALMLSHDLKEPLQQIIRLARRGQATENSPAGGRALHQVLDCAERADHMLDGMVEYLGIARQASTPILVDLNQCLNRALDNLRSSINEAHAEIRAAPLPTTMGDERQLTHLFQNLVSNAIKFRGVDRPVVGITVERRVDGVLLAFKDNGIGIPEPFLERIFELGARLHTREEYPGTGIGLALCRRIVERHGGRIWAESSPGGGSAFYVLLPEIPSTPAHLG